MKTTLMFAALSGLAFAQEHAHAGARVLVTPSIPGTTSEVSIVSAEGQTPDVPILLAFERSEDASRTGPAGFLGVNAAVLPRELSSQLSLPEGTGLRVEVVAKDSPAAKAGLQADDVLAKFDDQILIDPRQLSVLVANGKEGDAVTITYLRKGEAHETGVVLGKRPADRMEAGQVDAIFLRRDATAAEGVAGAPLGTFTRRIKFPDGGEVEVVAKESENLILKRVAGRAPAAPEQEDVKKQLAEIRAMLEALQQKVK